MGSVMTTARPAYRDDTEGARIRYQDLLQQHAGDQEARAGAARVRGRRIGRIAAGATGLAAFVALASTTACRYLGHGYDLGLPLSNLLMVAWPAMAVAYGCGRVDVWNALGALTERAAEHDDLQARIARLEAAPSVWQERCRADRLERASVALPMMAIALLAPLTIHDLVWQVVSGGGRGFEEWIGLSLLIVGHAHLALAYACFRFAREARETPTRQLSGLRAEHEWRAYGLAVVVSAIPGALIYLVPPLLTIVTGICFNPLMFRGITRSLRNERRLLGAERALG